MFAANATFRVDENRLHNLHLLSTSDRNERIGKGLLQLLLAAKALFPKSLFTSCSPLPLIDLDQYAELPGGTLLQGLFFEAYHD